jgi:hypothetical protein
MKSKPDSPPQAGIFAGPGLSVFSVSAGGYDPLEPGKIGPVDRGGAINLLMPAKIMSPNAPGQVTQGLVEIEKWEG